MSIPFDFEALRCAIETGDAEALMRLYADDAELQIVDKTAPPRAPAILRGRRSIEAYWRNVCACDMTHRVEREIVGENYAAFVESCTPPNGTRILFATVLELRDGQIARQLAVQYWDE